MSIAVPLPDVSLIQKFTGVIRPTWLEAKAPWIQASGLENIYPDYLRNSQRLQQIGCKFQMASLSFAPDPAEGALEYRNWQDREGKDHRVAEVVLRQFKGELQVLDSPARPENGPKRRDEQPGPRPAA